MTIFVYSNITSLNHDGNTHVPVDVSASSTPSFNNKVLSASDYLTLSIATEQ